MYLKSSIVSEKKLSQDMMCTADCFLTIRASSVLLFGEPFEGRTYHFALLMRQKAYYSTCIKFKLA